MSFTYTNYGPAYAPAYTTYAPAYTGYGAFSPTRTYTTTYGGVHAPLSTSYVSSSSYFSPSRTYTTVADPYAPAYTTTSYGLGGATVYSPGRTYTTSYGLGGSHVTSTYY